MPRIGEVINELKRWKPATSSEAKFACSFDPEPASDEEILGAFPDTGLPQDLVDFWRICRSAVLFEDTEFGQWGLRLWTPAQSAHETAILFSVSPGKDLPGDIIVGEFLGDSELLLVNATPGTPDLLIRQPLDRRDDWPSPASSLTAFLKRFSQTPTRKFWN